MRPLRVLLVASGLVSITSAAWAAWNPSDHYVSASAAAACPFVSGNTDCVTSQTGGLSDPSISSGSANGALVSGYDGTVWATATGEASASAGTGRLGIKAVSPPTTSNGSVVGVAQATLADVLTFHIPYGTPFVNSIDVTMGVHAAWTYQGPAGTEPINLTLGTASLSVFNPGTSNLGKTAYIGLGSGGTVANNQPYTITADIKMSWLQTLINDYPAYVQFTSSGYDIPFTLQMSLATFGGMAPGFAFDASHTAQLAISTPTGVTWSSASGLLLADAVPEPSTYALALLGAATLGCVMQRRRAPAR